MRRESFSVMMSESRALQRCGGAKQLIWARFRVDNVRQVPMMEEESAEPVPSAFRACLLYTSPSPRDVEESRMPSSA